MPEARHDLGIPGLTDAEEVGSGGFATVYRAEQPAFRRKVAVKVLDTRNLDDTARARFERECHALGLLAGHPGIVTVYDGGFTADGHPYLVMEYLQRGSLEDRVREEGPLPWHEAATIGAQIADALEEAHQAGIVHRDLKPANVLVDRFGRPQLGDFGIARIAGGHQTKSGVITASLAHAPPEVISRQAPTPRSDVYSLGSTLYELLAGRPAFVQEGDETIVPLLSRIASDPVPDLRPSGVPDRLCVEVERAMAKDPADRHASAAELARALEAAASEQPAGPTGRTTVTVAPPPSSRPPADEAAPSDAGGPPADAAHGDPPARRRPLLLLALLVVLVALVAGGLAWWLLGRDGSSDPGGTTTATVPDVVGDPIRSAEAELRNAGFLVVVRLVSDEAPIDEVLAQDPAAGAEVDEGATVTLQVSSGPARVTVPDLVGEAGFGAAADLEELGLIAELDEQAGDEAVGTVVEQDPRGGTEVASGSTVVLVLSSGPVSTGGEGSESIGGGAEVALPPVVGLQELDARQQLEAAGFVVEVVPDYSGGGEVGTVLSQDPPTSTAPSGSTVTLVVASLPGE